MNEIAQSMLLAQEKGGGEDSPIVAIVYLAIIVLIITGFWKTFSKAGKPGWGAIIPFYNMILLIQIAGRPTWWFILLFIPIVNLIVTIMISLNVAKNFGKGPGFGIGLGLLPAIFYPILGFGSAQYAPQTAETA